MQHVLTRQQLYDMIWERAVSAHFSDCGRRFQSMVGADFR